MWTVEYAQTWSRRRWLWSLWSEAHGDCVSSHCASVCLPFSCQNVWVSNTSLKTSSHRLNIIATNNNFHRYVTHQWWCNVTLRFSSRTAKYQNRCFMFNHEVRASHRSCRLADIQQVYTTQMSCRRGSDAKFYINYIIASSADCSVNIMQPQLAYVWSTISA